MEEETKTAIKMIIGLIVFGAIIGASISSAYWNIQYSSKLKQQSEVMARYAIINLDRANTYLMKGDNRTAWVFLNNAIMFTDQVYELDKDYKIIMEGDNYTARLFLESAMGFVGAINNPIFKEIFEYYENGTIIATYGTIIIYRIRSIAEQLKDFNISRVSELTERINKTIAIIMPYSDIPKYKDKVSKLRELYDKYSKEETKWH